MKHIFNTKDLNHIDETGIIQNAEFDPEFEKLMSPLPFESASNDLAERVIQKLNQPKSKKLTRAEKSYLIILSILMAVATILLYIGLPHGTDTKNPDIIGNKFFAHFNKTILAVLITLIFITLLLFIVRLLKLRKKVKELDDTI